MMRFSQVPLVRVRDSLFPNPPASWDGRYDDFERDLDVVGVSLQELRRALASIGEWVGESELSTVEGVAEAPLERARKLRSPLIPMGLAEAGTAAAEEARARASAGASG